MKSMQTKRALAAALQKLLSKKPINRITIQDLAEECGISRMTFYYHFRDIYDLVEWMCQEGVKDALGEHYGFENWQQGFENLLSLLLENKACILNVSRSVDREQLERYLEKMVGNLMERMVEEAAAQIRVSEEGRKQVAMFYTHGLLGMVMNWVRQDMKASPKELAATLCVLTRGGLKNALENVSRQENPLSTGRKDRPAAYSGAWSSWYAV